MSREKDRIEYSWDAMGRGERISSLRAGFLEETKILYERLINQQRVIDFLLKKAGYRQANAGEIVPWPSV